ncbi:MAG: tRNA (adenosine(37)-N6)-threonylcarbamoyltransferase complex ATPase subunit type 1 TsaE [Clostridiales bacterium GWF2_38_85]|nr:MAG: tRNA (adenosine(37)-N6)-threonylcarbamoyltransferase complex ATPase subunit type 1 TsaE [Clostridiales bacterium GWF2_38_85]HBL85267.1 tRNA (adenosine(37)-N6)-threonylcarbamoyltransferase complex ATPase subunit type 1 TsaE [Clostridiales bacterium]
MIKEYLTKSEAETEDIGSQIALLLDENSFVALYGELGAGKTVFVRGIVKKLIPEAEHLVHSPTFALVNEYIGNNQTIYHFDMYRITGEDDLYSIGFDDYFNNGIIITEWSENIESSIPPTSIIVKIERISDDERRITVEEEKKC